MSPLLVAGFSLLPGAGHWVLGKRGKAVGFFAIDLGIIVTVLFLRSPLMPFVAGLVYFAAMIPAVLETYTLARGGVSQFSESRPYIVALLLWTGFSALPLLWQSHSFSRRAKIAWSIAVPVLAVLYFSFLGFFGMRLLKYAEGWLR
jgi:hypothetical protein